MVMVIIALVKTWLPDGFCCTSGRGFMAVSVLWRFRKIFSYPGAVGAIARFCARIHAGSGVMAPYLVSSGRVPVGCANNSGISKGR